MKALALLVLANAAYADVAIVLPEGSFVEHKNMCGERSRKGFASVFVENVSFSFDAQTNKIDLVRVNGLTPATEAYVGKSELEWPVLGFWRFSTYTLIVRITRDHKLEISTIERRGEARCYEKWRGGWK